MNCVDYFFENSRHLEKDMLVSAKEHGSYRHMAQKVSDLSSWLGDRFGEDSVIILISPNNAFFVTAYLAIMKSGNVCVPLDPAIEPASFDYIRETTSAPFAFIHSTVAKRLVPEMPSVDETQVGTLNTGALELGYLPGPHFHEHKLAQLIFTSGSTAVPKGVMITHGNLEANTSSILDYLHLSKNDTMLVVLPFFYCYGLSLLHTHLRVGGTLALNNSFMFLGSVIRDLNTYKCTGFAGVPSHFQILLRKSNSFKTGSFPHLRYVTQAGGKLHTAFITEFNKVFPNIQFFVMYGQTEATARLSYLPPTRLYDKLGSIGKGIPNVELKVVDDDGNQVVPGVTGEIIARGKNVMKGYFKDHIATNEALRDGWLHTGDLGTVDSDGFIYLTARKKEMIKAGGKRVSPKEIEEVIVALPEVVDCTVEGMDHPDLGEAIRAVVVKAAGSNLSGEEVRAACASRLAFFKVPAEVVFKNNIEVSSTGKKVKGKI